MRKLVTCIICGKKLLVEGIKNHVLGQARQEAYQTLRTILINLVVNGLSKKEIEVVDLKKWSK